jgi:GntR family transcriptional repressor for pyruvate dehydrogenase complex
VSDSKSSFKPASRSRLYSEIVKQLVMRIQDGEFLIGDMLPGERELCEAFRVSRGPVREALKALELVGVVEVMPGKGTFVKGVPAEPEIDGNRLDVVFGKSFFMEVLEVRMMLEPNICKIVAQRSDEFDISLLESHLCTMKSSFDKNDIATFNQVDVEFHICIADGMNNTFLSELFRMLQNAMNDCLYFARSSLTTPAENYIKVLNFHSRVLDAIKVKDGSAAYTAMMNHLIDIQEFVGS